MTIQEILDHQIYGNAYHDMDLWTRCEKIALDESNPIELRAAAVRKIDKIVGDEPSVGTNEQVVEKYVNEMKEAGLA